MPIGCLCRGGGGHADAFVVEHEVGLGHFKKGEDAVKVLTTSIFFARVANPIFLSEPIESISGLVMTPSL
jgi:hypothetical protein